MFWTVTQSLISGLGTATQLFALTLLFGLPLGLVIAFGSMSKWRPLKAVVDVIVWIIRGTPLMLQLIIIYYGPGLWLDSNIWGGGSSGRMTACVIAFVINYSCYFSVIYRGGILPGLRGHPDHCLQPHRAQAQLLPLRGSVSCRS